MALTDIFQFLITGEWTTTAERRLYAARKGNADAQLRIGVCCYTGRGMPRSEEEAVKWFHLSAVQGNAKAQFYLGRARYTGEGTPKELESAYAWFHLSAGNGYRKAKEWKSVLGQEMTSGQIEEGLQLAQDLFERFNGIHSRIQFQQHRKHRIPA